MAKTAFMVRRPSLVVEPGHLLVRVPVKFNRYVRVLLASWLTVCLVVETFLLLFMGGFVAQAQGLWKVAPSMPVLAGFAVALGVAALFLGWHLLWVLAGRELVSVTRSRLIVRRSILGIGRSHEFPLADLKEVCVGSFHEEPVYPSWGRMFVGKGHCYLRITSRTGIFRFGRGLDCAEAQYVADAICERIQR